MAVNSYCTTPEFKTWAGLDDSIDDVTIDRAITAVSRGVDNFTKTRFWQTDAETTRVFDSCDGRRLNIDDAAAVTQIATDPDKDGAFETVWTADDYQLLPLNPAAAPEQLPYTQVRAVGDLRFPRPVSRVGLVEVTGTWGWPAIPEGVHIATLILVNRIVKRKESPEGVTGFDEFGQIRISARDDPDAVRYLTPYKRTRRAGGWAMA
jgi:hypothetical protein